MSKLTAEKCRYHIDRLQGYVSEGYCLSLIEADTLKAFEIALPVLERKPIDWWEEMEMLERDLDAKHRTYVKWRKRAEDAEAKLAELGQECQPATTPQIDNGGWVELVDAEMPVHPDSVVEVKMRNGATDGPREAARFSWYRGNEVRDEMGCDIIAYRVIENDGR